MVQKSYCCYKLKILYWWIPTNQIYRSVLKSFCIMALNIHFVSWHFIHLRNTSVWGIQWHDINIYSCSASPIYWQLFTKYLSADSLAIAVPDFQQTQCWLNICWENLMICFFKCLELCDLVLISANCSLSSGWFFITTCDWFSVLGFNGVLGREVLKVMLKSARKAGSQVQIQVKVLWVKHSLGEDLFSSKRHAIYMVLVFVL